MVLEDPGDDHAAVRARVAAEHRAHVDELLAEARYGHRQREDIRGLCWSWPAVVRET